jgi:hypothetical protein
MRRLITLGLAVAVAITCTSPEQPERHPSAPLLGRVQDLIGMPDLIVNQHKLASSWVIYEETFAPTGCTAIEGGFEGGTHRTLRFTVSTPNIGTADVFIGSPLDHVDPNRDGDFSDSDGLYEFAECHQHFHFRNYATYEIFPVNAQGAVTGPAIQARKRGFCMIDIDPYREDESPGPWVYRSCGSTRVDGFQGISVGYADTYVKWLTGQFFLLTDTKEPIVPGRYMIRITVNPPFTAKGKELCPARDANGLCHMFAESDYDNNVAEVVITVPDRVGKMGWGPGGGKPIEQEIHPGDTKPATDRNGNSLSGS